MCHIDLIVAHHSILRKSRQQKQRHEKRTGGIRFSWYGWRQCTRKQCPAKARKTQAFLYISAPCFMNSTALASMPFCKASASESFWLAALPQRRNSHRRITANLSAPDPKTKGAGVMYK
jgi:hypothetical protein